MVGLSVSPCCCDSGTSSFHHYKDHGSGGEGKGIRLEAALEWSADGKKIIFAKLLSSLGSNYEIFIVDVNGENEKQITDRPYHTDYNSSIHPNGVDILFDSSPNIGWEPPQILHNQLRTLIADVVAEVSLIFHYL
ncbi:MAG: hypothetical protein IIA61_12305 [Candidatus Marinimicrobia bacterium]|nr:hypothetical protein [Candidatus Neomarinimicrobiota bacterium]